MTIMLRFSLIAASVLTTAMIMHKIRKSKAQIEDSIFWVLFSLVLILFSVFPKVAYWMSDLVGTYSPSNFIFTLVIFLLLVKVFSMSVRISQLEAKLRELVQRIALDEMESGKEVQRTASDKMESGKEVQRIALDGLESGKEVQRTALKEMESGEVKTDDRDKNKER